MDVPFPLLISSLYFRFSSTSSNGCITTGVSWQHPLDWKCSCSAALDSSACTAIPDCHMDGNYCKSVSCSDFSDAGTCDGTTGCYSEADHGVFSCHPGFSMCYRSSAKDAECKAVSDPASGCPSGCSLDGSTCRGIFSRVGKSFPISTPVGGCDYGTRFLIEDPPGMQLDHRYSNGCTINSLTDRVSNVHKVWYDSASAYAGVDQVIRLSHHDLVQLDNFTNPGRRNVLQLRDFVFVTTGSCNSDGAAKAVPIRHFRDSDLGTTNPECIDECGGEGDMFNTTNPNMPGVINIADVYVNTSVMRGDRAFVKLHERHFSHGIEFQFKEAASNVKWCALFPDCTVADDMLCPDGPDDCSITPETCRNHYIITG